MTRADRARDLAALPVYLLGGAAATEHRDIAQMPDLTVTAAVVSGARAFAQAGVRPSDFDVVELYDAFTNMLLMNLEDLGFCGKGEGPDFVRSHTLTAAGSFPHNTSGGQLSVGQAGAAGGFLGLVETVRQLTDAALGAPVPDAEIRLVSGFGRISYDRGLASGAALLAGGRT